MSLPDVSPSTFRRITWLAVAAQVFIVVTGAAVRLTGSGLGCSDWPTCEEDRLVAPLEGHALVEFGNRTVSGLVLLSVVAAIVGARKRVPYRSDLLQLAVWLLVGVLGQVVLGGIVVRVDLAPVAVIGHFVLSIVLIWIAVLLHERAGRPDGTQVSRAAAPVDHRLALASVIGVLVVVLTGTVVTATGPHSGDTRADRLDWFDITEVVRVHATSAIVTLALVLVVLATIYRNGASADLRRRATWATAAIVVQGAIGYAQYFTGVPPLLVALHVLGATLVWIAVLRLYLGLGRQPSAGPNPASAPRREGGQTTSAGAQSRA